MTPLTKQYIEKLKELVDELTEQAAEIRTTPRERELRKEIAEIGKQCQFELLCDPDIFEASANEHFEQQIKEEEKTINTYGSCKHLEKYRFIDRDGNLRCSDCHKVIQDTSTLNNQDNG